MFAVTVIGQPGEDLGSFRAHCAGAVATSRSRRDLRTTGVIAAYSCYIERVKMRQKTRVLRGTYSVECGKWVGGSYEEGLVDAGVVNVVCDCRQDRCQLLKRRQMLRQLQHKHGRV